MCNLNDWNTPAQAMKLHCFCLRTVREWQEYDLVQGERLMLVTDGVTETHGPNGTLFGRDRLVELLETSPELILNEFIDRIKHALAAFQQEAVQHDDVTIVLAALDSQTSSYR